MASSFKAFCFLIKPFKETFWNVIFVCHSKMKRFMNTLNFVYCFGLEILSCECVLFLISLGKK